MKTVNFEVAGRPTGKGRPRFTRNGHVYTPKTTTEYENTIKQMYRITARDQFFSHDVSIGIVCFYRIPKNTSRKKRAAMLSGRIRPNIKPDIDNVAKIVMDALNGVAYEDDKQVINLKVSKYYSDTEKITVAIKEI